MLLLLLRLQNRLCLLLLTLPLKLQNYWLRQPPRQCLLQLKLLMQQQLLKLMPNIQLKRPRLLQRLHRQLQQQQR
jgi:hypothetical protein